MVMAVQLAVVRTKLRHDDCSKNEIYFVAPFKEFSISLYIELVKRFDHQFCAQRESFPFPTEMSVPSKSTRKARFKSETGHSKASAIVAKAPKIKAGARAKAEAEAEAEARATVECAVPSPLPPATNVGDVGVNTTTDIFSAASKAVEHPIESTEWTQHMGWGIIQAFFGKDKMAKLVAPHIESYNHFVNTQLPQIIDSFNPIKVEFDSAQDAMNIQMKKDQQNKFANAEMQSSDIVEFIDVNFDDAPTPADKHDASSNYAVKMSIVMTNPRLCHPQTFENNGSSSTMFPQEARVRKLNYMSVLTIDFEISTVVTANDIEKTHRTTLRGIQIGKIPIMLKSDICVLTHFKHMTPKQTGECPFDCGGYFIIKGGEKAIEFQEKAADNTIMCSVSAKPKYTADVRSVAGDGYVVHPKLTTLTLKFADGYPLTPIMMSIHPSVHHKLFGRSKAAATSIPLWVLMLMMGVESDCAICHIIFPDFKHQQNNAAIRNILEMSIQSASTFLSTKLPSSTDEDTASYHLPSINMSVVQNDFLPHCNTTGQKIRFLGKMARQLILTAIGQIPASDKDAYKNKSLELSGPLMGGVFRAFCGQFVNAAKKQIVSEIKNNGSWRTNDTGESIINVSNAGTIFKSCIIEKGMRHAISTGDFGTTPGVPRAGVSQALNRHSGASSLSQLRHTSSSIDKKAKIVDMRALHPSSYGVVCPAETPEGKAIGLILNLALLTQVTISSDSTFLWTYIMKHIIPFNDVGGCDIPSDADEVGVAATTRTISGSRLSAYVHVIVNGSPWGISLKPMKLYWDLKQLKLRGNINPYTSIVFSYATKEIYVNTRPGRYVRPMLRVMHDKLCIPNTMADMLTKNCVDKWSTLLTCEYSPIEFIDAFEQSVASIAEDVSRLGQASYNAVVHYTHAEIHPVVMFGIIALCIPFADRNQSPRNTYQSAHGKQSITIPTTTHAIRTDKTTFVLSYPQRPFVTTRIINMLDMDKLPTGSNLIIAIACLDGYNQEDSLLINRGSIDRGQSLITVYNTKTDEVTMKVNGNADIRCNPDPINTRGMKKANYNKLGPNGFVPHNTLIENHDIQLGKKIPIKNTKQNPNMIFRFEDRSEMFRAVGGEDTYIDQNTGIVNGDGYFMARSRTRCLRVPNIGDKFSSRHGQKGTCGAIKQECDMPYTADGLRPDAIINPHAIPSRMTVGHLLETQLGHVLQHMGMFGDGTTFGGLTMDSVATKLAECGLHSAGDHLLYDGSTGKQLRCAIFMGPVYYQRLKHITNDKVHSRAGGQTVNLTRQPMEGRSNNGGSKIGEMERDNLLSHGGSQLVHERMFWASDKYDAHVCRNCGILAAHNNTANIHKCTTCDNTSKFSRVKIPYSCKLLFQEMNVMGIAPRIITAD